MVGKAVQSGGIETRAARSGEIEARGIWMEFPARDGAHLVLSEDPTDAYDNQFVSEANPVGSGGEAEQPTGSDSG